MQTPVKPASRLPSAVAHVIRAGYRGISSVYVGNPTSPNIWSFGGIFPCGSPRMARGGRASGEPSRPIYICEHDLPAAAGGYGECRSPGIRRSLLFMKRGAPDNSINSVDRLVNLGKQTPRPERSRLPLPARVVPRGPRACGGKRRPGRVGCVASRAGLVGPAIVMVQPGNHRSMRSCRRKRWRRLQTDDKAWPIDAVGGLPCCKRDPCAMPEALIMLRGSEKK